MHRQQFIVMPIGRSRQSEVCFSVWGNLLAGALWFHSGPLWGGAKVLVLVFSINILKQNEKVKLFTFIFSIITQLIYHFTSHNKPALFVCVCALYYTFLLHFCAFMSFFVFFEFKSKHIVRKIDSNKQYLALFGGLGHLLKHHIWLKYVLTLKRLGGQWCHPPPPLIDLSHRLHDRR